MPSFATDALVLRTYRFGETSRVVVFLTRERGKQRAVAKGARGPRSRYRGTLETLSEVRVGLSGRQGAELLRLGQCELLRSAFPAAGDALAAGLSLSYFAELLEAFSQEGEAEEAVYRLAVAAVRALGAGAAPDAMSRYLEAWLLKLNGLYPPLDRCAACGRPLPAGALRYQDAARGFVCDDCGPASGPVLPAAARAFLAEAFRRAPDALTGPVPAEAAALAPFHQDRIEQHLERALRSERVLKGVARGTGR